VKPVLVNLTHSPVKHLWPISALADANERVAATVRARIHEDLPRKTGWLQQAPCITCIHATNVAPLTVGLPIRTRPFSAQSMDAPKLASLKQKITHYLASRNHDLSAWVGYELCVTVLAIVPQSEDLRAVSPTP
jgi:hypothetical protein